MGVGTMSGRGKGGTGIVVRQKPFIYRKSLESLLCSDGCLWSEGFGDESLEQIGEGENEWERWYNLTPIFDKQNITIINCVNESFFGTNGFWRQQDPNQTKGWKQASFHDQLIEWEFNDKYAPYSAWYLAGGLVFFENQDGVYEIPISHRGDAPDAKLRFKGRSIVKIHGKGVDPARLLCLLDDGHLWIRDDEPDCGPLEDGLPSAWCDWKFFQDKHVEQICCGHSYYYVVANGVVYCKGDLPFEAYGQDYWEQLRNLDPAPEECLIEPIADPFFNEKHLIKMEGGEEVVMAWCEEGLFLFHKSNGATPITGNIINQVPDKFLPVKFFQEKTILDISVLGERVMLVMCQDGVWLLSDTQEYEDYRHIDVATFEVIPTKFVLDAPDRVPLVFDKYFQQKKRPKSSRSGFSPPPKRSHSESTPQTQSEPSESTPNEPSQENSTDQLSSPAPEPDDSSVDQESEQQSIEPQSEELSQ